MKEIIFWGFPLYYGVVVIRATLHMPHLKGISFEIAITERCHRGESNAEEALIEMYPAGAG